MRYVTSNMELRKYWTLGWTGKIILELRTQKLFYSWTYLQVYYYNSKLVGKFRCYRTLCNLEHREFYSFIKLQNCSSYFELQTGWKTDYLINDSSR